MAKRTVMVICAHNDDQIIGAGGTVAKYAKEGKKVVTVIVSYGELSHPHLKPEVITKTRVKESHDSDKILGCSGVVYLGMGESEFMDAVKYRAKRTEIKETIKKLIEKNNPTKIFTHSVDDPHGMHRKVNEIVMEIVKETKIRTDVYSFDVWNPVKIRGRNAPKMVVDITDTFDKKIKALKAHKSQQMTILSLLWNVYMKAVKQGWHNNCKYAEIFYKLN
jgi:LmbE family N-acetylglucosaminyl deacetylase